MSVRPISPDNRITCNNTYHVNHVSAKQLLMFNKENRISLILEMRPIATIFIVLIPAREIRRSILHGTNEGFQSPARCGNGCGGDALIGRMKSENRMDRKYLEGKVSVSYPLEKSRVSKGFSEKKCSVCERAGGT